MSWALSRSDIFDEFLCIYSFIRFPASAWIFHLCYPFYTRVPLSFSLFLWLLLPLILFPGLVTWPSEFALLPTFIQKISNFIIEQPQCAVTAVAAMVSRWAEKQDVNMRTVIMRKMNDYEGKVNKLSLIMTWDFNRKWMRNCLSLLGIFIPFIQRSCWTSQFILYTLSSFIV